MKAEKYGKPSLSILNVVEQKNIFRDYLKNLKVDKTFFLHAVTTTEIRNIILSFDTHKSLGPNSIPTYILKIENHLFSDLLAGIVNLSFKTGIFPDLCKLAKVIPIFKKDDPLLCSNYRPISLLPIYSKIFEKVIYTRMYSFLTDNNLLYDKQFGFRANYSTNHALISTTEQIKLQLDKGNFVGGVFIDLEKAFDTVNHNVLIEKLYFYGFRGVGQELIKSFLQNRQQYVSINGFDSNNMEIKCGVPQGSTLGPLLFLIYINDFRLSIKKSVTSHFADDTCIFHSSKKIKSLETELNFDLKLCSEWLKANRLSLNVDKSKFIFFHSNRKVIDLNKCSIKLNGKKLIPADHVKYLGIYIDKNLKWDHHIKQLGIKLSRSNGILYKLKQFCPKDILNSLYYSIFYSHILYACPIWSLTSKKNLTKITILQKKCIRIINSAPFNSHTNGLFFSNNILKFQDVIACEQMKLVFEFKNKNLPKELNDLFTFNHEISNYQTRNARKQGFFIPTINTDNFGQKSLRFSAPILWNQHLKLDESINLFSKLVSFKKYLKQFYINGYKEE